MMTRLLYLVPALLLIIACNDEVKVIEKYDDENIKSERTFKDGKLVGEGVNYDAEGRVSQRIFYNNGKEDSTLLYEKGVKVHKVEIRYNEAGRLIERSDYAWHENDQLKFHEETKYDDARLKTFSVITNWKKNGVKYSETENYYTKGERDSSKSQNWFHGKREVVHQYYRDNALIKINKEVYKGDKLQATKTYVIEDDSLEMIEVEEDDADQQDESSEETTEQG